MLPWLMEVGEAPLADVARRYGLTEARLALAAPDAIVMHPGPINRGVEMETIVADGSQSVILHQVSYGVAVRMAVMEAVAGRPPEDLMEYAE